MLKKVNTKFGIWDLCSNKVIDAGLAGENPDIPLANMHSKNVKRITPEVDFLVIKKTRTIWMVPGAQESWKLLEERKKGIFNVILDS